MSKQNAGRKRRGRTRQTSSLKEHRQTQKTLTPPLRSFPTPITDLMWARDQLPDLLWLASMLSHHGERHGLAVILATLDLLEGYLPDPVPDADGRATVPFLTGALTTFELVPEPRQQDAIAELRKNGIYDDAFPWLFARAMSKYQNMPGAWLLTGWTGPGVPIVGSDEPERFLREAISPAMHGQSRTSTLTKMVVVSRHLKAGRLHFPESMRSQLEALSRYPFSVTEDERSFVEPFLRATFAAIAGTPTDPAESDRSLRWARDFWRANWSLYSCETTADTESGDIATPAAGSEHAEDSREEMDAFRSDLQTAVDEISAQFGRAHTQADPDLYEPDRNEVLTGITARHLRAVDAMVRYPALWTDEQGTFVMRNLLEGRIVLRWLIHKDDPTLFRRFKDYGRGHLKLQVLHLREYRDKFGKDGEPLDDYLQYLEQLLNRDRWEEMQDISLDGNFAGVDTRRMALAVGMEDEYRLLFAPMSSDVHGEWASLDRHVMVACENVLHRSHRIPNPDRRPIIRTDLVAAALDHLQQLVDDYSQAVMGQQPATDGADHEHESLNGEGPQRADKAEADEPEPGSAHEAG